MINYFEMLDLPVSFRTDPALLKKHFYKLSRQYHPDHFTLSSEAEQRAAELKSEEINTAYKTLSDERLCMRHILDLNNMIPNIEKETLPQDFLMEMMDINESIFDLQTDFDEAKKIKVLDEVASLIEGMKSELDKAIDDFENQVSIDSALKKIKDYYLKSKYLLRIQENISTFASL